MTADGFHTELQKKIQGSESKDEANLTIPAAMQTQIFAVTGGQMTRAIPIPTQYKTLLHALV